MATLSDIRTQLQRDLRDISGATWTSAELNDMINQGLDALADVYPREVTDYLTIASGAATYAPAVAFTNIYRVDIHTSADSDAGVLEPTFGMGRGSGWEWHAGLLWIPPGLIPDGYKLRLWGYARYAVLTSDNDITDADAAGVNAVRAYSVAEAFGRLTVNRAAFQQWQAAPGNTDISAIALMQFYRTSRFRWREEQQRLRRMRKRG